MINFKDNETTEEEPIQEEETFDYDEQEDTYCD